MYCGSSSHAFSSCPYGNRGCTVSLSPLHAVARFPSHWAYVRDLYEGSATCACEKKYVWSFSRFPQRLAVLLHKHEDLRQAPESRNPNSKIDALK